MAEETKELSYTQKMVRHLTENLPTICDRDVVVKMVEQFGKEEGCRIEQQREATKNMMTWGKFSGKTFAEIKEFDSGYFEWLKKSDKYLNEYQRAVLHSL